MSVIIKASQTIEILMKHTRILRLFHSTEEMQYHLEINHLNDNGLIFQHDNNPKDTANVGKAYLDRIE